MKEWYSAPELNVLCFAPVERLANNEEELKTDLVLDITTYGGQENPASNEDEDFGLDIL